VTSALITLTPSFIFLGIILLIGGVFWLGSIRTGWRSPLTRGLLRGPGHSLVVQIEDLSRRIDILAMAAGVVPLSMYASYISRKFFGDIKPGEHAGFIYLCLSMGFVSWTLIRLLKLQKMRRAARLGLDCEMAVGQELNTLVAEGYKVYHDIPAEGFNIDHVAVGPNGVFAIETKGRSKPDRKRGTTDATVVFDGQSLAFPHSTETEPLNQARRQAQWLSKWLTSAIREKVGVYPVLALPGWYIVRKKWCDVFLLNGKEYGILTTQRTGTTLSDVAITRISHQLDQRCRDVEPKAYSNRRKPGYWKKSKAA
jgi:hypothetical protein